MKKKVKYFKPGNILIYVLVGYAFLSLYQYRYNDPAPIGTKVPNFRITTLDDQNFKLTDVNIPKAIIFLDHKSIYAPYYLKIMPEIKILNKSGKLYALVFLKENNKSKILEIISERKYKVLENITYLTNIDKLSDFFGVRSWPHFFILDSNDEIIYDAKLPSMREVQALIRSN